MTRRAALKVGALGVIGAAAAAYLPGRARGSGIAPAPCQAGQGSVCGSSFTACGGPGSGCGCAFQYTGSKLTKVASYCVDYNVCCSSLAACPGGQSQCPANTICSNKTCCSEPVCMPACGANVTPAACCLSPKGQVGGATCCSNPGTCSSGSFPACGAGVSCDGLSGCYCFTTAEGGGACAQNVYCSDVCTCSSTADCPSGNVCIVGTGCNCSLNAGVCAPLCGTCNLCTPVAPVTGVKSGVTAAMIKH